MSDTFDGRAFVTRLTRDKKRCSECGAEEATVLMEVTTFGDAQPRYIEVQETPSRRCPNGPHYVDAPPRPPVTVIDITPQKKWWQTNGR